MFEKYGHYSDNLDYAVCLFLAEEWGDYSQGDFSGGYSPESIISITPTPKFSY